MRVQKTDLKADAASKDLQSITTDLAVNWNVDPAKVNQVFQQIGDEEREHLTFAVKLEIGVLRQEAGGRRKEEEGRSQKKCFYKYEMLPEEQIVTSILSPAISEFLKAATSKKTAEEIITKRTELKTEIDNSLKKRLQPYGVIVNRF